MPATSASGQTSPACPASAATTAPSAMTEPGEMSTERETMPIIAPTATMASVAFCSTSATRFGHVAKRGLMTTKTSASDDGGDAERAPGQRARRARVMRA